MRIVNLLLALDGTAHDAIKERKDWDEEANGKYKGPVKGRTKRFFDYAYSQAQREKLYRTTTAQSKTWTVWSLDFDLDSLPGGAAQAIRDELTELEAEYPNRIIVMGAWWWDGRPVGMTWVDETDPSKGLEGTPVWDMHPKILEVAPKRQVVDRTQSPPVVTEEDPVDLSGMNLTFGQKPRMMY